jgi:probable addiction module antidote protein
LAQASIAQVDLKGYSMNMIETCPWDAAGHLQTAEDMAAYLNAALADGEPALIVAALGDIARAIRYFQNKARIHTDQADQHGLRKANP